MIGKIVPLFTMAAIIQLQAGDPLKIVREKGFYKSGAAAKNTNFVEWLAKPLFGEGSSHESRAVAKDANTTASKTPFGFSHRKIPAALQLMRDQGYKEKEARMRRKSSKP